MDGSGGGRSVGVDVGGTKVLGVALQDDEVLDADRLPTARDRDELLRSIRELADRLDPTAPVGLGLAGFVSNAGVLTSAPNVPVLTGLSTADICEAFGRPVRAGNDANCAALAELRSGAGQGADDLVLLTFGTGIGGGIIAGGRLVTGSNGFAGELGHMVVDPRGPWCPCGQRGCWERLASGTALDRVARAGQQDGWLAGDAAATGRELIAAARSGDTRASAALDEWSRWLALGVVNVVNLFDPERIVLAGGLAQESDMVVPRVQAWRDTLWNGADSRQPAPIVPSALGGRAGAIGAALLAAPAAVPDQPSAPLGD